MTYEFNLPDLGEGLVEAQIVGWLVSVGDLVQVDQPVVEVQTAKALVEIPTPVAGTVLRLGGEIGASLAVGSVLLVLDASAEERCQPQPGHVRHAQPARLPGSAAQVGATPRGGDHIRAKRPLASPATRKLATELDIDLRALVGSGPVGRITKDNVLQRHRDNQLHAQDAARPRRDVGGVRPADGVTADRSTAVQPDTREPLRGIRREIALTMAESWRTVPHITEFCEVDATRLVEAMRALRDQSPEGSPPFTFLPLLVMAAVTALQRNPGLNASLDLDRDEIIYHGSINVGIATSTEQGLMVPVVRDAASLGLYDLSSEIERLVNAARKGRATVAQMTGGTFTVTNFGSYGTWLGTPIIRPPEAMIVGFGRIRDSVVAVDGKPTVRPILPVAASADHRLVDGEPLGRFVNDLSTAVENPYLLLARRG